jgi:ring-1,2-phenylacetyl-CoA epoxidase subunit PaaE
VHAEVFHVDSAPVRRTAPAVSTDDATGAEVTITLDGRRSSFRLAPDGPPVLDAAVNVRADVPFACKGGVCGTCRAKVVEGQVAMDSNYALEPDEVDAGYVLTCQSHPTTDRVVLDYDA